MPSLSLLPRRTLHRRLPATPAGQSRLFYVPLFLKTIHAPRALSLLSGLGCLGIASAVFAQTVPAVGAPGIKQIPQATQPELLPSSSPVSVETATADLPNAPGFSSSVTADPQQTTAPATPTSAPNAPQTVPAGSPPQSGGQTKRILGVIPNYRSVSADQHLPAQTVKDKFVAAGHDSFDYGSFVLAAVQAGFSIEGNSYPEFGKGVLGYGRYYWRTLLDTADENFMVGGVLPSVLHQDSRFYTLGHGSIPHRLLYASTRVLITRGDSGAPQANFSEIIGAGAAAGISSTYYPERYRTWTKVGQKWLTSVLIDGANFSFKEFWPDINEHLLHGRGGGLGTK